MIKKIGAWALRKTCEDAANWPVELRVAVNVSAVQFEDDSFPDIVQQAIEYSRINPARVELEITEGIFVGDYGRSKTIFARLRKLGVRSEEHTSELQSLMRISYAVFCLK